MELWRQERYPACNSSYGTKNCCALFCSSVVTEGPETCQHRDAARYRPHRQVTHAGVRVPGETFKSTASTCCMTRTLFCIICIQMLKYIYLHNYFWPFLSVRAVEMHGLSHLFLPLSPASRTKISSSTWMIVGTSWACRMSRWVSAGVLLPQPTQSGSAASRSNTAVNSWNAAIAPPGGTH